MKPRILSLLVIIGMIVLLAACIDKPSKWKIKTEYYITKHSFDGQEYVSGDKTDTFFYKEDGFSYRPKSNEIVTEESKGNVTTSSVTDKDGNFLRSSVSFMNEDGSTDSIVYKDPSLGTYLNKYVYDEEGRIIENRSYPLQGPKAIWTYIYDKGNIVEERMTHTPSTDTSFMPNPKTGENEQVVTIYDNIVIYHDYFTDKPNMPTTENFGYKSDTSPKRASKNLKKRSVQVSLKGDTTDVFDYRYRFDDKGRVISVAQTSRSGAEYDSTAYTYY